MSEESILVEKVSSKRKKEIVVPKKKSTTKKEELVKLVSGETYIYLKRLSHRLVNFISKKYPGKKKISDWDKIFKKENIS